MFLFRGLVMPSWGPLGVLLGPSWGPLGALLGVLEPSWGSLGGSGEPLGAVLGPMAKKEGVPQFPSPPRRVTNAVLGPSWAALGALLGALGAALGPSWAPLGALLGHLGAILRPQDPIGSEKARKQTTLVFPRFWSHFGISGGPPLGGSEGT